jgi:2-(1,2-epoxy-1,2-dihydrophenyl)acetyl-CoA isomerase
MNRPNKRNALDDAMRRGFAEAVARVRDDPAVKAVVLTGAGGHFCGGGDIASMANAERGAFTSRERIRSLHRWFDELVDLEKPVISAVDGVAFGAGLSLALSADLVLASKSASFNTTFARIGLVPDMGAMYLLPRLVGLQRAKELVFSARTVDAEEALRIGLICAIAEDDVLSEALALASTFHAAPTEAIGLAKAVMNRSFESDRDLVYAQESLAQAVCRESEFHLRAVERFLGKR